MLQCKELYGISGLFNRNLLSCCLSFPVTLKFILVMEKPTSFQIRSSLKNRLLFFSLIVFSSSCLFAQTPVNFSGTWIQDNSKSDAQYAEYNIKLTIAQTPQSFVVTTAFGDKSGKELSSGSETFNLDGKETVKNEDGAIQKESASWSTDGKTLTTKVIRTNAGEVYGSTTAYSLSNNGLVLNIKTENVRPGQPPIIQVLNKQK